MTAFATLAGTPNTRSAPVITAIRDFWRGLADTRSPVSRWESAGARGGGGLLELFGGLVAEVPRGLGGVAGVVGLVDA